MAQPPEPPKPGPENQPPSPPRRERVATWLNTARANLERMIAEERAKQEGTLTKGLRLLTGGFAPRPGERRRRRSFLALLALLVVAAGSSLALPGVRARLWSATSGVRARLVAVLQDPPAPAQPLPEQPQRPTVAAKPRETAERRTTRELTAGDIVETVKKSTPTLASCFDAALDKGLIRPGPHKLTLNWLVRPDGGVNDPQLIGPAKLVQTPLAACVTERMRRWQFPPSRLGAPVRNFPLGPLIVD